ncbi:hypothetical protein PS631_00257 [Pseudomonas fluorescens]|uniref:Uncharacterized protein n=1 Tax=Pseudomonas fluorescens TaxID=294 RepID=A0A5E6PB64_PSEFL|nr:hypothetical protein [Pseudomonas fluorescens]VVM40525.1 hypothetical protein PS631_00257 [Pseudomonas fluorescens]
MNHQSDFHPRQPALIDWDRPYDIGPSDEHLHAIGQFMANYSMVEWELSGLFAFFLSLPIAEAQRLAVDSNLAMAGKLRYVQGQLEDREGLDQESAGDLLLCLKEFETITKLRHKIVHWQWGLNEGSTATLTDLIKPRNPERATINLPLTELRDKCMHIAKIYRALSLNFLVISGQYSREQLLSLRKDTSPERLFRP